MTNIKKNLNIELINFCPLCKSNKKEIIYRKVFDYVFKSSNNYWTYYKCGSCKSIYAKERIKKEYIHLAYKSYYTHENSNKRNNSLINTLKNLCLDFHIGDNLSTILNKIFFYSYPFYRIIELKKGSVFDVGCGTGELLVKLKNKGLETLGLEIDPKACDTARKNNLEVINGSFQDIENLNKEFDYIISSHVIEHVYDPDYFFKTIFSKTKVGGKIFLSLPCTESILLKVFKSRWRGLEAPRHLIIPSSKWFLNLQKTYNCQIKISYSPLCTVWGSLLSYSFIPVTVAALVGKTLQVITKIRPLANLTKDFLHVEITKK